MKTVRTTITGSEDFEAKPSLELMVLGILSEAEVVVVGGGASEMEYGRAGSKW